MKKIIYLLVAISLCGFFSATQTKKPPQQEEEMEEKEVVSREGEIADCNRNRNDSERNDISLYEKNERRVRRQAERYQQKMRCQRCRPQYYYQTPDDYSYPSEYE